MLYPLEIHNPEAPQKRSAEDVTGSDPDTGPEDVTTPDPSPSAEDVSMLDQDSTPKRRPVRASAKAATEKRRVWIRELQSQD